MSEYTLEQNDYKILIYISKHNSVSKEKIMNHFSNKIGGIETRLESLSTPEYSCELFIAIRNTSYIEEELDFEIDNKGFEKTIPKGIYHITDFGKKTLQDYQSTNKAQKIDIYFDRVLAIAAFIISVIALLKP